MHQLTENIGKTPLFRCKRGFAASAAMVYAKLERFNPGGSIKDRNVRAMLETAQQTGALKPGMTLIEAVAGNTGIALAMQCRRLGYSLVLVMPEDYMPERRYILECLGVQLVLTPAVDQMAGAYRKAQEILRQHPDYYMPDHFHNQAQVDDHSQHFIQEILDDLSREPKKNAKDTPIDVFLGCYGSGSHLAAAIQVLKPQGTRIIALRPNSQSHAIPGIGFNVPAVLFNESEIDHFIEFNQEDALRGMEELARETGILAGLSSGANYVIAKRLAAELGPEQTLVTTFYDGGERYLSLEKNLKEKLL